MNIVSFGMCYGGELLGKFVIIVMGVVNVIGMNLCRFVSYFLELFGCIVVVGGIIGS